MLSPLTCDPAEILVAISDIGHQNGGGRKEDGTLYRADVRPLVDGAYVLKITTSMQQHTLKIHEAISC